jgi:hypothetical protein
VENIAEKSRLVVYDFKDGKELVLINSLGYGKEGGRRGNIPSEVSEKDRERVLQRAYKNARRICLANDLHIHMILTISENSKDADLYDKRFKKFMFELRKIYPDIKYLAVRELQERGALHYHVLINRKVSFEIASDLWKYGYIWLQKHENGLKAIMYVCKYIKKSWKEVEFMTDNGNRKKVYLCSQGMLEEVENYKNTHILKSQKAEQIINDTFLYDDKILKIWDICKDVNEEIKVRSIFIMTNCGNL